MIINESGSLICASPLQCMSAKFSFAFTTTLELQGTPHQWKYPSGIICHLEALLYAPLFYHFLLPMVCQPDLHFP